MNVLVTAIVVIETEATVIVVIETAVIEIVVAEIEAIAIEAIVTAAIGGEATETEMIVAAVTQAAAIIVAQMIRARITANAHAVRIDNAHAVRIDSAHAAITGIILRVVTAIPNVAAQTAVQIVVDVRHRAATDAGNLSSAAIAAAIIAIRARVHGKMFAAGPILVAVTVMASRRDLRTAIFVPTTGFSITLPALTRLVLTVSQSMAGPVTVILLHVTRLKKSVSIAASAP